MSNQKAPPLDAGRRSLDHYKKRLPPWRLALREVLIKIVRHETPLLAQLQRATRSPALDTYFALTATLGTHTFFMMFLPILYWCGYAQLARGMIHVLAFGVIFTGFAKDLCCIPRPLSPPLERISRSVSAALEYGFPSTHSTNAVSVVIYGLFLLYRSGASDREITLTQALLYVYTASIILGRLYCGMHGFFDVVAGSALGAVLAVLQCLYGDRFDNWVLEGPIQNLLIVILVCCVLVRIHPEPADDCPCYDDSVSFSGVIIGIELGAWQYSRSGFAIADPIPSTTPFSLQELGWIKAAVRIVLGVLLVFMWRALMKPTLLRFLPPVFRVISQLGLLLPRKFFLDASEYGSVPPLKKDDSVIPPASDIPSILGSLRNPKSRTVSVGPQSEADAYEAMYLRERKRRMSREGNQSSDDPPDLRSYTASAYSKANAASSDKVSLPSQTPIAPSATDDPTLTTSSDDTKTIPFPSMSDPEAEDADDQELFSKLQVPRVRYDVEVVTRLIVYTGIGWLAAMGGPVLFELIGLGMGVRP